MGFTDREVKSLKRRSTLGRRTIVMLPGNQPTNPNLAVSHPWKHIIICICICIYREVRIEKTFTQGLECTFKTEDKVFLDTDRPRPVNNIFSPEIRLNVTSTLLLTQSAHDSYYRWISEINKACNLKKKKKIFHMKRQLPTDYENRIHFRNFYQVFSVVACL